MSRADPAFDSLVVVTVDVELLMTPELVTSGVLAPLIKECP